MSHSKTFDHAADVRLLNVRTGPIKRLSGFQKHHRVPATANEGDLRFLHSIVDSELNDDLDSRFNQLRKAFGFKRKQVVVDGPGEGGGVISTPYFNYEVNFEIDSRDPSQFVCTRAISGMKNPEHIFNENFALVFGDQFTHLQVTVAEPLDVEAIIDRMEDLELPEITIDYDKDATHCAVRHSEAPGYWMDIRQGRLMLHSDQKVPPAELMKTFLDLQNRFVESIVWNDVAA